MNAKPSETETIVACATGQGHSAIAVIRMSGPAAFDIVAEYFSKAKQVYSQPRTLIHGWFRNNEELIDEVLVCGFVSPFSFTGENTVEIQSHGSPIVVERILTCLIRAGARLAEPGEFTRRAVLNGKMNLMQAESLADLIAAESLQAYRLALDQYRGSLGKQLVTLRDQLIQLAALLELELDFSEEDVEFANRSQLRSILIEVINEAQNLRSSFASGHAIRTGIPIVIAGLPNAGKSTLLNALLDEERSIVSDIPGTTRDVVKERFFIDGFEFHLIDTAGIRDSLDPIEQEGIRRTWNEISRAGVILALVDATQDNYSALQEALDPAKSKGSQARIIWLANKIDLLSCEKRVAIPNHFIKISAKNKNGLEQLKKELADHAQSLRNQFSLPISNARHYAVLERVQKAATNALKALEDQAGSEIISWELKESLLAIGELTGQINNDEVLGHIFSKFCIGK